MISKLNFASTIIQRELRLVYRYSHRNFRQNNEIIHTSRLDFFHLDLSKVYKYRTILFMYKT